MLFSISHGCSHRISEEFTGNANLWHKSECSWKGWVFFFFFLFFCLHWMAYGILVPWPGIEPMPPAVEAWCLNDWTTRDVPDWVFLYPKCLAQPLAHSRSSINICWIKFSCSYGLGLFDDVSARFLGTFEIYVWLLLGKPLQSHFWFWLDDSECWQMKKVTLHSDMGKHYRISEILNTNLNKIDMRGINKDTTLFLGNRGGFCVFFFFFSFLLYFQIDLDTELSCLNFSVVLGGFQSWNTRLYFSQVSLLWFHNLKHCTLFSFIYEFDKCGSETVRTQGKGRIE